MYTLEGFSNFPVLKLEASSIQQCLWKQCFHFETSRMSIKAKACSMSTLLKENKNLSAAQKVLFWHNKLSHATIESVHNIYGHKWALAKRDIYPDSVSAQHGSLLPCTFNVPNCNVNSLHCLACCFAKSSK